MPRLIDNFSSYFFKKQRDLYFIVFTGVKKDPLSGFPLSEAYQKIPGREELLRWFAENLPDTEVGPIYTFTSDSGIIAAPYDGSLYVDFSPEEEQKFSTRWETSDGKSIDPRWQCYHYPLEMYKERYGGRIPNPEEFMDF